MYLLYSMIIYIYTFLTNTCIERQYIKGFMNGTDQVLLEYRRKRIWMRRKEHSHSQKTSYGVYPD